MDRVLSRVIILPSSHRPPVYQSYPSYSSSYPTTNTYHPGFGAVYGYRSLENPNFENVPEDSDENDRVVIQIPYMAEHSRFVLRKPGRNPGFYSLNTRICIYYIKKV